MELETAISSVDQIKTEPFLQEPKGAKALQARAVIFEGNQKLSVGDLPLIEPSKDDLVVDVHWSGVSTGTERLLWASEMPMFPGLSYPLVPGYEAVGTVRQARGDPSRVGETVFVPGGHCFKGAAGLFGASATRLVVPADRCIPLDHAPCEEDVLLALAATAHHAIQASMPPQLIVGHGVVGRLMARITLALGYDAPTVWEINPDRRLGANYPVLSPDADPRKDYASICDVSGSVQVLDDIIAHSEKGATIVLAGFYSDRPNFAFPAAFMREITLKIAAEWTPEDIGAVQALRVSGALSFDGLVTHARTPGDADAAYRTAFGDPSCLKMVLDWREFHDHAH